MWAWLFLLLGQKYADNLAIDHPAIHYLEGSLHDPVARLQAQLEDGKARLDFAEGTGYLPSLLAHLDVPADSQALVFSKTSFQSQKISPRNPRAIYFGDDVAVGFVRGGEVVELAALDPMQGVVFYTLSAEKTNQPHFRRREECLRCHQGPATLGVPGIFVGSVYPGPTGLPDRAGAIITDHGTAFEDRWGGWYVNALRGEQKDRANSVAPDPEEPHKLETVGRRFNSEGYLSDVSDIVALMTFEHQTKMTNLITRLGWESRMGKDPAGGIEDVANYMLFTDEVPLKEPIQGVSTFTETFPRMGPRDKQGRSLRDFDLQTRLFRYPLSYMIYSPAFNALPDSIRTRIYERISSRVPRAVLEILRDTKADWPRQ
ncbi:MAG: hypothetical protein ABSF22_15665 [Bryobacteraceae bacterium]